MHPAVRAARAWPKPRTIGLPDQSRRLRAVLRLIAEELTAAYARDAKELSARALAQALLRASPPWGASDQAKVRECERRLVAVLLDELSRLDAGGGAP